MNEINGGESQAGGKEEKFISAYATHRLMTEKDMLERVPMVETKKPCLLESQIDCTGNTNPIYHNNQKQKEEDYLS